MPNIMSFNGVEKATEFIKILLSTTDEDTYCDIHVRYQDCNIFLVEWEQVPFDGSYGGTFQYVDEEHEVCYVGLFPDNHEEWFSSREEFQESLREWLAVHPSWKKNEWGRWYDAEEEEKLRKELLGESED